MHLEDPWLIYTLSFPQSGSFTNRSKHNNHSNFQRMGSLDTHRFSATIFFKTDFSLLLNIPVQSTNRLL